jgi:hypothetical protein
MNKDNPIHMSDVIAIQNVCNKIQKELDTDHCYSPKDQNKLMKLLDDFKDKYDFLSCQKILSMYKIPSIVKFRLQLE